MSRAVLARGLQGEPARLPLGGQRSAAKAALSAEGVTCSPPGSTAREDRFQALSYGALYSARPQRPLRLGPQDLRLRAGGAVEASGVEPAFRLLVALACFRRAAGPLVEEGQEEFHLRRRASPRQG